MSVNKEKTQVNMENTTLMKKFSTLWSDTGTGPPLRISLIITISFLGIIMAFYWKLPPEIPLTYSKPWGLQQLVSSEFLFILFVLVILIEIINLLISAVIINKEELLARIFVWINALVVFLIFFTVFRVVITIL